MSASVRDAATLDSHGGTDSQRPDTYIRVTPAYMFYCTFRRTCRRKKKKMSLFFVCSPACFLLLLIIRAFLYYILYRFHYGEIHVQSSPLTQLFFLSLSISPPFIFFLSLLSHPILSHPIPSPSGQSAFQSYFPLSFGDLSVLFPLPFFLPLAIIVPLIMVGIWIGATFCSFTRARTCQNGIVGVLRRIDIPGIVFIRMTGYAELYVTARVWRRTVFPSPPHHFPLPLFTMSFESRHISIFSLFLLLSLSVIKGVSCVRSYLLHEGRVSTCSIYQFHSEISFRFRTAGNLGFVTDHFSSRNFSSSELSN